MKGSPNNDNGKLLYDFILSKEGQKILVANNLLSVRNDVEMPGVDVASIAKSAMTVDLEALAANSDEILTTFDNIFKK